MIGKIIMNKIAKLTATSLLLASVSIPALADNYKISWKHKLYIKVYYNWLLIAKKLCFIVFFVLFFCNFFFYLVTTISLFL